MSIRNVLHYTSIFGGGPNTRKLWQFAAAHCRYLTVVFAISISISLTACGGMPSVRIEVGTSSTQSIKYESFVVADEPEAALVARDILMSGGNATDAAVALGFSLAATLPSAVGLGGGGVCMRYDPARDTVEALEFLNSPSTYTPSRFVRGLYALHAKYGSVPWSQVVTPAENLARFGFPMSKALARDLDGYGEKLFSDRATIEVFLSSQKDLLQTGELLSQPSLASTLGTVRDRFSNSYGVDDFENEVAAAFAKAYSIGKNKLSRNPPPNWRLVKPRFEKDKRLFVYTAKERANLSIGNSSDMREFPDAPSAGSSEFIVSDALGQVVTCALTMGQPFGIGVMLENYGFLLGAGAADKSTSAPAITMAYLIGRSSSYAALIAASAGPGAKNNVLRLVDERIRRDSLHTNAIGAHIQEHSVTNMVTCEQAFDDGRIYCRAFAGANRGGYAAMINLEK